MNFPAKFKIAWSSDSMCLVWSRPSRTSMFGQRNLQGWTPISFTLLITVTQFFYFIYASFSSSRRVGLAPHRSATPAPCCTAAPPRRDPCHAAPPRAPSHTTSSPTPCVCSTSPARNEAVTPLKWVGMVPHLMEIFSCSNQPM